MAGVEDMEEVVRETGLSRKAKVVSTITFPSRTSNSMVLKVGYELRTGERIFQFFSHLYKPSLDAFMRATGIRWRRGSLNASRALGKEVRIKVRQDVQRGAHYWRAEVQ